MKIANVAWGQVLTRQLSDTGQRGKQEEAGPHL